MEFFVHEYMEYTEADALRTAIIFLVLTSERIQNMRS